MIDYEHYAWREDVRLAKVRKARKSYRAPVSHGTGGMNFVTIRFNTDNAAFEDLDAETARILRALADRVEYGSKGEYIPIMDINGNQVGHFNHDPD